MDTGHDVIGITSKIKSTWTVIDNPVIDLPALYYQGEVNEKDRVIKVSGSAVKLTWIVLRRLAFSGSTKTTYAKLSSLTGLSKTQLHRVLQVMINKGWVDVQRRRSVDKP